jgi:hypothetical protein
MGTERQRELRRRRTRKTKLQVIRRRAQKASTTEKQVLADKLRALTPGAESVIQQLGLTSR